MKTRIVLVSVAVLVTMGLLLVAQYLGPAGSFVNLLLAVPVAYVAMRAGMLAALLGLGICAVLQYFDGQPWSALIYVLQYTIPSLVLPLLLKRGYSLLRSWFICLLLASSGAMASALLFATRSGSSLSQLVASYVTAEVAKARQVYEQADVSKEQLQQLYEVLDKTALFLQQAYVGLAVLSFAAIIAVTIVFLRLLASERYYVPAIYFHELRVPDMVIWLLIAAGFGMLVDSPAPVQTVSLNVLTVLLPLYFLQGVAILTFFFRKKGFPVVTRVLGYILILIINPLPLLVTAVGVFDLWFDFRKPRVKTT